MKKVCLFFLLFASSLSAQDFKEVSRVIVLDSTVQNYPAEYIYNKIELWFGKTYKDSDAVLKVKNKDNFTFQGKGATQNTVTSFLLYYTMYIKYDIEVLIKNNKFKIIFSNFHEYANKYSDRYSETFKSFEDEKHFISDKKWKKIKTDTFKEVEDLIKSMNAFVIEKKDDF
jgi:hypothetical protein